MLILDDRAGSVDYLPLLQQLHVPVSLGRLDFGDAALVGNGPNHEPVFVGVEIKKLADILRCIVDGRYAAHQLPGMLAMYKSVWLLIEGEYRPDPKSGVLQQFKGRWVDVNVGSRRFMYREFDEFLMTCENKAGVKFRRSATQIETAYLIKDLYHWWTAKAWEEHKSLDVFNNSMPTLQLQPPTLIQRIAKELPGVGWKRAREAASHFNSIREMIMATEQEWQKLDGVGPKMAERIVEAVSFTRPAAAKGGWRNG